MEATERDRKIWRLTAQGLSLREVADNVGCSHTTVKRTLQTVSKPAVPTVEWQGQQLTRRQVTLRLHQLARRQGWVRLASYHAWQQQITQGLFGSTPTADDDVAWLLLTGPTRPGRRPSRDDDIKRHDSDFWKNEWPLSDYVMTFKDGTEQPLEWHLEEEDGPEYWSLHLKSANAPRVPPGTTPVECPRCHRLTFFREPGCWVTRHGERSEVVRTRSRSKCCSAGTCPLVTAKIPPVTVVPPSPPPKRERMVRVTRRSAAEREALMERYPNTRLAEIMFQSLARKPL